MNHYQPFPICLRFWIVSLKMFLSWVCLRKNKYPGVQRCVFLWWLDNTPVPIRTFNENYSFWKFLWKYYRLTDWWRTDTASNRDARMHLMTTLFHLTNHLGKVPKQNAPFLTFLWKPDGHSLIRSCDNYWEKNRNFFDFLSHGVEIWFSNFRLRHFEKVESFLGLHGTSDGIDRGNISDNSTPSG